MTVITRFAPSPTGLLHIGNARTALVCYLYAKQHHGKFMLRLDDTDTERSKEIYANQIQEDLTWLGLKWDIFARQSERKARYEAIKHQLASIGRLYPCYETPEEIEIKRKMLLSRGKPPIYDRAALRLTDKEKKDFEAEGRPHYWRFKLDESKTIEWNDIIKGKTSFKAEHLSDPVVIRANGEPTYLLPSTVDDIDFNITHIVRGEDHVSNTAIQIQMFEALGAAIPTFAHTSLIKTKDGKISKREGGFDIAHLKNEDHIEAMAINSLFARLGTSDPVEPRTSLQELIDSFDLSHFTKTAAIYDPNELVNLNAKIIHTYPYESIASRPEMHHIDKAFFTSVQANLTHLTDIQDWHHICKDALTPVIAKEDESFLKESATLLPALPWTEHTWDTWLTALKEKTDRKGKTLFMPLRKSLTAQEHGPELKHLLPLIGRDKAIARLNGETA